VLEANFEKNTLQMLKKYFANVGNFGKKLCIEPGHEKSPMEKHKREKQISNMIAV